MAGEFKFALYDNEGSLVDEAVNGETGIVNFNKIEFTKPGEYTYTVKELPVDNSVKDNYVCDESVYTVKITVSDDKSGNLHAAITYYKNYVENATNTPVSGIEFINTYKPSPIHMDLSTAIRATKSVVDPNGNALKDHVAGFDFEVVDVSGNVIATGESDDQGKIKFTNITFKVSGEYQYRIREAANADKHGYILDQNQWEVHILVRYYDGILDQGEEAPKVNGVEVQPGSLYIAPEECHIFPVSEVSAQNDNGVQTRTDETPAFVNTYAPTPVSLTLTAMKELTGRELKDNEFTFHLMEGDTIRAEATNAADGTVSFYLNYTMPGDYSYVIHEHIPEANAKLEGVTYDQRTFTVNVSVKDVGGKLVINGDDDGTVSLSSGAKFVNSYKPGATTATIMAQKTLTGKTLKDGEFTFELLDKDNKVIDTVTNDGMGNVIFVVDVPEADTYTYTIREKAGTDKHVKYDPKSYKVTVKAEQNAAAKLVTTVTYDTADGVMPTFENTYTPDGTSITLTGTKTLTGRTMTAGEFKFQVHDSVGTLVATGTNDAEKNIIFDAISLPVAGRYELTVTEVNAGAEGMTYDDTKFVVTVDVANKDGVLDAVATYPEGGIAFANIYEEKVPEPTEPADPTVPNTGDNAKLGMWIALLVVSGICICAVVVMMVIPKKKGKYEK